MPVVGGIQGQYKLRIQLGTKGDLVITPTGLVSLDIFQYLDRLVPTFHLVVRDTDGYLANNLNLDSRSCTLTITFQNPVISAEGKVLRFRIYRKKPTGLSQLANMVVLSGALDVKDLFAPRFKRGWYNTPISTILQQVGKSMGIRNYDIEAGMNRAISVVQPNWTNAQFLQYLCEKYVSAQGRAGFYCFIDSGVGLPKGTGGVNKLTFRSLQSLIPRTGPGTKGTAEFNFDKNINLQQKSYPIVLFTVIDNFEVLNMLSIQEQEYNYFNYTTGKEVSDSIPLIGSGYVSLSPYISTDPVVNTQGVSYRDMDRSTEFVPAYLQESLYKGNYFKRINALNKLWIVTCGVHNLKTGDCVNLVYRDLGLKMTAFNHTGVWMIERIVHHFSQGYSTQLLLTRAGVSSGDRTTTLQYAGKIRSVAAS